MAKIDCEYVNHNGGICGEAGHGKFWGEPNSEPSECAQCGGEGYVVNMWLVGFSQLDETHIVLSCCGPFMQVELSEAIEMMLRECNGVVAFENEPDLADTRRHVENGVETLMSMPDARRLYLQQSTPPIEA